MMRWTLPLVVGTFAAQLSSFRPGSGGFVALLVAAIALSAGSSKRFAVVTLLAVLFFVLHVEIQKAQRLSADLDGERMLLTLRVSKILAQPQASQSFVALPVGEQRLQGRLKLAWYDAPVAVKAGDTWRVAVKLRRPSGYRNPGTSDRLKWVTAERFVATGTVINSAVTRLLGSRDLAGLPALRQRIGLRIAALGQPDEVAALTAVATGDRRGITADRWESYAATGTSHLMAISGLHIGLSATATYGFVCGLLGFCRCRGNQHDRAMLTAIAVAAAYAVLSGFAIPSQRALIMLLLVTMLGLMRRQLRPLEILACAVFVTLLADPLKSLYAGFGLSYAAVLVLLWSAVRSAVSQGFARLAELAGLTVRLQLALLFGLAPLVIAYFDRISLIAPLVNLLAVPIFSVVTVPLALIGIVLDGPAIAAGDFALRLSISSLSWIHAAIDVAQQLPLSSITIAELQGAAKLALWLPCLWVLLPRGWPGRYVAVVALMSLCNWRPPPLPHSCLRATTLDVGQGQAVVVQTKSSTLLYDTGPRYLNGASAAEFLVLPYLRSQGVHTLDTVVVSHSDLDHAGGLRHLLKALGIRRVFSGDRLDEGVLDSPAISELQPCQAGVSWFRDGIRMRFLHPEGQWLRNGNDASCVLLLEAGKQRLLLTGDIEAAVERSLVSRSRLPAVDVVSVPHHGSSTSSTPAFVSALRPRIAIVSAASGNHWGFPRAAVVARWTEAGARVLSTASSGAIDVTMCAGDRSLKTRQYRSWDARVWHDDS